MGQFKDFKDFSVAEVSMWLTAQGLGDHVSTFVKEGVDGDLLVSLTKEELQSDLGLSGLKAKRLMSNIEFTKNLAQSEAQCKQVEELQEKISALEVAVTAKDEEIAALEARAKESASGPAPELAEVVAELEPASEPASNPVPAEEKPDKRPASKPASRPPSEGPGVVAGGAIGAAGGAAKGALLGAIVGDPSAGAKLGAALGGTRGGLVGLANRRDHRRHKR